VGVFMAQLLFGEYDRAKAVNYAHLWAYGRNPAYYNFEGIGGDCTNFASQCLFAGTRVMNYTPTYGWFYINANKRSPAWSSVIYLYNFLTGNDGIGPYGRECQIGEIQKGDLVQLIINEEHYQHTPVIVFIGENSDPDNILVAAHSYDCDYKPLSGYNYKSIRFIHIEGFRHL